ncbi:MAG: class I SAM-dependent methyltransferase, partial [Gammaproteobacteria bacterium]|nr:class I SAM-dependent methyltransferase [Gammaproteobacteria bacterium]
MSHKTARKYSRIAHFFDFCEFPIEYMVFRKLRSEVVSMAEGHVLEIGVGTGKNLAYYSSGVDVQAIDFSHGMLQRAVGKSIPEGCKVNFYEMDVQKLEFEENLFDCSISTFVFCTVPDAKQGLSELYRVSKPGGKAIF